MLVAALLALAALALADPAGRRRALMGTVAVVLALVAHQRAMDVRGTTDQAFLLVNGSIFILGIGLQAVALVVAWRAGVRVALVPVGLASLALVVAAGRQGGIPIRAVLIGLGGALLLHGAAALIPAAPLAPPARPAGRPWWVGACVAALALFAPHAVVMAAAMVGLLLWIRRPVAAALAGLALSGALWVSSAIAGPVGLGLSTIAVVPFSPYAEVTLGAVFIVAALIIAGVLPFGWRTGSAVLAPVAAALVLRIVLPALPEGVVHWRSPISVWLLAAGVVAAVRGRVDAWLAATGLYVLFAGSGPAAGWSGLLLTVVASGAVLMPGEGAWRLRGVMVGTVSAAMALAAGLGAALEQEVVYSVLFAALSVVLLARLPQWRANTVVRDLASNATTS
jgi:hypothetical protein